MRVVRLFVVVFVSFVTHALTCPHIHWNTHTYTHTYTHTHTLSLSLSLSHTHTHSLAISTQVIALAGAQEFGETTGRYFHMHKEKPQRADATDKLLGQKLWNSVAKEIAARYSQQ